MKQKLLFLLTALMLLVTGNAWAEEASLNPVGVFTWTNTPAIVYDGEATSWAINQGGISGGNIGRYTGPYAIIKFDASSTLDGMTLISATLDFDITAGSYNSSINIAQMTDASFTPSTVTTATFNKAATQFQSGDWSTKNATTHFSYDVKSRVVANNVLAFAIYTNTAREQTLKNVKLKLSYSASAADYTVKYVSTIADVETEIKSQAVREGEVDATVTLEASDKNVITYEGHQFYYVSDNASSSTIANDNSTVVKVVFAQATFDNGDYYFKNKSNGAYFAAGNNWGTHAVSNMQGHVTALTVQPGGKYHIDTHISNGGNNHYLNGEYTDGAAQEWAIASDGAGYYTINNGSGNLTAGAVGENLTVGASTGDNAKWTILTTAEWKADQEARLAGATAASGEDATFYIAAPNFPRNDNAENAKWQGNPTIKGYEGDNGNGINYNGEKFTNPYATFDVYQALTGVKPGAYKLTAQGFYRNGLNNASDANDNLAKLYANSSEVALKNIRYYGYTDDTHSAEGFTTEKSGIFVPDDQSNAGLAFNANKFENELYVVVGEDGNLRVGVKKDAATGPNEDWAVFDNFKLTYYGNTVSVTLGTNGYATFASPYALDLANLPSGLKAYKAQSVNSTYVHFEEFDQTVPANTGILFEGTASETYNIPVVASGDAVSGNLFRVNEGNGYIDPNYDEGTTEVYYFAMIKDSDPLTFGKFNPASYKYPSNKAYLIVAKNQSPEARLVVSFDEEDPTGINAVEAAEAETGALKDGKYLIDGKIVLVKNGVKYSANGQKLN